MNELDYIKSMFDKYISECENLSKEPPNGWTESAANKSKSNVWELNLGKR